MATAAKSRRCRPLRPPPPAELGCVPAAGAIKRTCAPERCDIQRRRCRRARCAVLRVRRRVLPVLCVASKAQPRFTCLTANPVIALAAALAAALPAAAAAAASALPPLPPSWRRRGRRPPPSCQACQSTFFQSSCPSAAGRRRRARATAGPRRSCAGQTGGRGLQEGSGTCGNCNQHAAPEGLRQWQAGGCRPRLANPHAQSQPAKACQGLPTSDRSSRHSLYCRAGGTGRHM